MARSAFVAPVTKQIFLPGDWSEEWIEVKEKLSYGEEQRLASASLTSVQLAPGRTADDATQIGLDMEKHAIERIALYVTEWSLKDHTGRVLPVTKQNIKNLDPSVAEMITSILDDHVREVEVKESPRTLSVVPDMSQ